MTYPLVRLDECARIVSGATPSTNNPEYWDGNIHWVTPADISNLEGPYISETPRSITEAGLASCAAEVLPAYSVLFSSRAPIGSVAINTSPMATNQGFKSFVPSSDRLDPAYLYHWLRANRQYLESQGNGATFKEMSKAVVARIRIPLPPLDEQRRIAAILDQADDLRRGRREALARLEGLAEAAFAEMFGVASRLTETHLSRLGEYLNFITSGGRNWAEYYSPVGHRFIRSFDVQMNHIGDEDIVFVDPPNNAEALRTRTQAGDVVLTITGSRIGRVATIPEELAGSYISQHVAILRVKSEMMIPHYLSFFLSLRNGGQRLIAKAQYGQTKPGLNFEQIRDFRVPVPPMARQKAFLECVERIEATRRSELRHAAKLDALFASLQHRAFRGEL